MNTGQNKNNIEEILSSLDGVKRATASDFFYTRLKARMEAGLLPQPVKRSLYPAYALGALLVILLLNAAVLFTKSNSANNDVVSVNETETLQSIAAEYSPGDVNSLYDLNEEK